MNVISIAMKDLRIFLKDRGAVVLSLILPLVFIILFSGALNALAEGGEEDDRIPLSVANLDGATRRRSSSRASMPLAASALNCTTGTRAGNRWSRARYHAS